MGNFTVGQIVHYVAEDGTHYAALVVDINGDSVDLAVFGTRIDYYGEKMLDMEFRKNVVRGVSNPPNTYHCLADCN
jgi:hypothetical protein